MMAVVVGSTPERTEPDGGRGRPGARAVVDRLRAVDAELDRLGGELVPERLAAHVMAEVSRLLGRIERRVSGARVVLATSVARSGAWKAGGARSPEEHHAKVHGLPVRVAREELLASERLERLPVLREATVSGDLSGPQVALVTDAASVDPSEERRLLSEAAKGDLTGLRHECRKVRARRDARDGKAAARMHARRALRVWTENDGEGRGAWNLPPGMHAQVLAALEPYRRTLFREAVGAGRRTADATAMADALHALAVDTHADLIDRIADDDRARLASRREGHGGGYPPGGGGQNSDPGPATTHPPGDTKTSAGSPPGDTNASGDDPLPSDPSTGDTATSNSLRTDHPSTGDPRTAGDPPPSDPSTGNTATSNSLRTDHPSTGDPRTAGDPPPSDPSTGDTATSNSFETGDPRAGDDPRPSGDPPLGGADVSGVSKGRTCPCDGPSPPGPGRSRRAGRRRAPTQVQVMVDLTALRRGHVEDGERCEIPGLGPIPVTLARELAQDALLRTIIVDGTDITAISTNRRYIPADLRAAVDARYPACAIDGCHHTRGLQYDHGEEFARGGPTSYANLTRLCPHHHGLKTYAGWTLTRHPHDGTWTLEPP